MALQKFDSNGIYANKNFRNSVVWVSINSQSSRNDLIGISKSLINENIFKKMFQKSIKIQIAHIKGPYKGPRGIVLSILGCYPESNDMPDTMGMVT